MRMFKFFEGGSLSRSKDSVPVGGREGAAAGLASSWESSGGRGSGLARSISSLKLGRSGHRGDRGSQEEGVDRRLDKRLSVKSSASGKGGPALRRSNTLPSKRRVSGFSHPHRDEVISGRESRTSHEGGSTTTEGSRFADTLRRLSRRVTGKRGHSRHTDEELSRGSSVCTLRHEDHEFPSHYLSVSEVATSELVSPDVSLMDLGSIDATPTISPFGSQGLAFPRQASLGSLKHVRSHAHTLSPDLSALCHILATFRDPRGCPQHEIYENVSPGHSSDLLGTNGLRPHSPASSLTSSARGEKGSGVNGRQEVGAQGHACPSCQVSFLTTLQLLDHWATFHTHDDLHTLPPRPHYGGHALEERDKSTHLLPGPREGTLKEITSSQQQQQQQQQEDPTSSQPSTVETQRHVFKVKKIKKARACQVCHQPVVKIGSCCRVCKYLVHKACEPKNNNEAVTSHKQPTISSRNTQSAARLNRVMVGGEGGGGGGSGSRMDVVYVTERIISLAFPPTLDDATYTLHLREVAHMLSSKHGDNFKVFNLSGQGEVSHFLPRVLELGWPDQLAPALERLCSICKALDSWITQHPQHVAVLHARGGYEKLGVVVAAYMHYSNICASTDQALDRYAMKRFFDDKIGQLYHPSQKRYVHYFAGLLSGVIRINSSPLYLNTLILDGIPHFEPRGGCHLFIKIYQGMTPIYTSGIYNLTETMRQVTLVFEMGVQLRGDILLKAYHRRLMPASREVIFRMQFHTCTVSEKVLSFTRNDLDDACNDMRFPLDGSVELHFTHSPEDRPRSVSNVSCDKSPCAIASWDSYENINFTMEQVDEQGVASVSGVSHTLGPLDGSLYATVTKKRQPPPPASPHSPVSPQAPAAHTPSPHGLVNGRYAASIDSGIASSNSAGAAPVSPPTSDTSQTSGESRATAAAVATGRVGPTGAPPLVDARQLDELLQGMLLDIQSIPDLRPSQTPAPDIDSIKCPDFSVPTKTETRGSAVGRSSVQQYGAAQSPHSPVNGYSGSTTHDSLLDTSLSTNNDELPYHARSDSKPFSYGAVTSSPLLGRRRTTSEGGDGSQAPPSPSIHRRNSRETLGQARAGLESPRLVRRMSGTVGGIPGDPSVCSRRSPSRSPSPEPGSRGGTLQRQRSHTLTTRIMSTGDSTPTSTLTRSEHAKSASRLDDSLDFSTLDHHSRSLSSSGTNNLSWLQMQQRKLAERREAKYRAERGPQEARMLSELRTRMTQQQHRSATTTSKEFEDGYVSDTTMRSETSRESSPVKTMAPLTINTGVSSTTTPQKPPIAHSTPARGNSAPSSPILPTRSASRERMYRNNVSSTSSQRSLPRKYSDMSDKERPFVAVRRAHENAKAGDSMDSSSALSQLQTSPLGHINYSSYSSSSQADGLLTTVISSSNQEGLDSLDALSATLASLGTPTHPPTTSPPNPISSTTTTTTITTTAVTTSAGSQSVQMAQTSQSREESTWQSDTESSIGGTRPITPGFPPATPTTPYLNQGLPPKSPTMQRKEMGMRSPSPATSQALRQELNGHSSPAPSLYHGQSRRSSLTSLNESTEVISSHPKFVKDISKFWYKPTITRDEAISMLRDKAPGTFVVRDSNSFPGAFGLALKVSTPPPNVASKSSDPANELVRHFLIEPTSRGVRLKGCANEPVFGSLSALVYQHSITALALPCRLMLPERDPAGGSDTVDSGAGTSSTTSSASQLLQQGAACNVMYLHTADTESLTGPQAVKRAVNVMLASKITPTVVHFKVSAQGITLTDNERKLFFRRHYPVNTISHCGVDPEDRRWTHKSEEGTTLGSLRIFGFVAKKGASRTENQCHVLAELEPEQPATAICNFVTKVMMTSVSRPNLV